jgi:hypothetical protein
VLCSSLDRSVSRPFPVSGCTDRQPPPASRHMKKNPKSRRPDNITGFFSLRPLKDRANPASQSFSPYMLNDIRNRAYVREGRHLFLVWTGPRFGFYLPCALRRLGRPKSSDTGPIIRTHITVDRPNHSAARPTAIGMKAPKRHEILNSATATPRPCRFR